MGATASTSDCKTSVYRSGFRREADMLSPLRDFAGAIVGGDGQSLDTSVCQVLFEVPAVNGVVDVLYVAFDEHIFQSRRDANHAPIIEWHELVVFAALRSYTSRGIALADLAARVGMTPAGLRRGALSRLAASGHIDFINNDLVVPAWTYHPPVRTLIAVEAKRHDWRRATSQARRYTEFADRSFIAVEPTAASRAQRQSKIVSTAGVGILVVDPGNGSVQTLVSAPVRPSRVLHRMFVSEQALQVGWNGGVSGPIPLVFGRRLTTSKGPDPRL